MYALLGTFLRGGRVGYKETAMFRQIVNHIINNLEPDSVKLDKKIHNILLVVFSMPMYYNCCLLLSSCVAQNVLRQYNMSSVILWPLAAFILYCI